MARIVVAWKSWGEREGVGAVLAAMDMMPSIPNAVAAPSIVELAR
jgi:hypothetical protein